MKDTVVIDLDDTIVDTRSSIVRFNNAIYGEKYGTIRRSPHKIGAADFVLTPIWCGQPAAP